MGAGLLAQYVVIGLAVVASIVVVLRTQFPGMARRLRIVLALPMLRAGAPVALKSIGRWIAPPPASGGKDCGGCDSCD